MAARATVSVPSMPLCCRGGGTADAGDLKSPTARCVGSIPTPGTMELRRLAQNDLCSTCAVPLRTTVLPGKPQVDPAMDEVSRMKPNTASDMDLTTRHCAPAFTEAGRNFGRSLSTLSRKFGDVFVQQRLSRGEHPMGQGSSPRLHESTHARRASAVRQPSTSWGMCESGIGYGVSHRH